jgi:uncharacterized membrane protein YkoI
MIRTRALVASLTSALLPCLCACQSPHEVAKAPAAAETKVVELTPAPEAPEGRPAADLTTAIAAACKSEPDGRFLGASLSESEGKLAYHVVLLGKGVVHVVNVDAKDGKLLESQDEDLEEEMQSEIDKLLAVDPGIGIEKAIAAALAELPGSWARAAGMSEHADETCYGVLLVQGEGLKSVLVAMKDGKILQVSDAEEDEEGEEGMEESEGMEGKEKPETPAPAPTPAPK